MLKFPLTAGFVLLSLFAAAQTSDCPSQVTPNHLLDYVDALGVQHSWLGIDVVTADPVNGPSPIPGTVTLCARTFFNDTHTKQGFKNSAVSINHLFGSGTLHTNQDRALSVYAFNNANDSGPYWGLESIQTEIDLWGTPQWLQVPDSEVAGMSVQASDHHVGTIPSPNLGFHAARFNTIRDGGNMGSCYMAICWAGVTSNVINTYNSVPGTGQILAAYVSTYVDFQGYDPAKDGSLTGVGFFAAPAISGNVFPNTWGFYSADQGAKIGTWNFYSSSKDVNSGRSYFGGPVVIAQDIRTNTSAPTDLAGQGILPLTHRFAEPYTVPPICVAQDITTGQNVLQSTTKTHIHLEGVTGNTVNYICIGRKT
ncbi:MAG: hypothetical protein HY010_21290 [Acidobacteria bacterium]|nr:hypothetical protein [Acidobacteriota bacterium]